MHNITPEAANQFVKTPTVAWKWSIESADVVRHVLKKWMSQVDDVNDEQVFDCRSMFDSTPWSFKYFQVATTDWSHSSSTAKQISDELSRRIS